VAVAYPVAELRRLGLASARRILVAHRSLAVRQSPDVRLELLVHREK
jgi:hypothetical protein